MPCTNPLGSMLPSTAKTCKQEFIWLGHDTPTWFWDILGCLSKIKLLETWLRPAQAPMVVGKFPGAPALKNVSSWGSSSHWRKMKLPTSVTHPKHWICLAQLSAIHEASGENRIIPETEKLAHFGTCSFFPSMICSHSPQESAQCCFSENYLQYKFWF